MIRVGIFREGDPNQQRGLIKIATQEVPADSKTPEADAWRLYTRTNVLPAGDYAVMILGKRYRMEETRSYKSTDLGPVGG